MARRLALVVGVSAYRAMPTLPASRHDAEVVAHTLRSVAGFDNVGVLLDPDHSRLSEAIEFLFAGRGADDLVLLYFSGHGLKDERGLLHLATPTTRKHPSGELVRSTAVSSRHIHDAMQGSRARRQVIILDCCFSAAFAEGMVAKDGGPLDLRAQLGGEGKAVLASSASTQFSFDTSKSGLSLYTEHLVHGLVTGEADLNHDGQITVDELHEYARTQIRASHPALSPQILPAREGYSIVLANARKVDPRRVYIAKIRQLTDAEGQIPPMAREVLALRRQQLGLGEAEARILEDTELAPLRDRAAKRKHLRRLVYRARRENPQLPDQRLLHEFRITAGLVETDLQQLLDEPLAVQRRLIRGRLDTPLRFLRYGAGVILGLVLVALGAPLLPALEKLWELDSTPESSASSLAASRHAPRQKPDHAAVERPHRSEDAGPAAPTPDAPAPSARRPTTQPPAEAQEITGTSWVLHLACKNDLSEARRLSEIAATATLDGRALRPLIVRHSRYFCIIVGPYSEWEANRLLPDAKKILHQGGYVREMRRWCPYLEETDDGIRRCYRPRSPAPTSTSPATNATPPTGTKRIPRPGSPP